jgi:two-component system, NarL family, nitrate/nitrite response regulator NarL
LTCGRDGSIATGRIAAEREVRRLRTPPPHVELTPRQRDLVRGVVSGRKNREMAVEYGLTEQAVKNVLSTVYHKCHVRNRLELAMFALQHHLVSDEEDRC